MTLDELKEKAVFAAKEAGIFLKGKKFENKEVFKDEGRDIKLVLDQEAEKLIRIHLEVSNIKILGEEYGGVISKGKYWVVDPIDGTANYFRGLDECCVSIALMEGKEALIGVIYNFNNGELYTAIKNQGAFLNHKKFRFQILMQEAKLQLQQAFQHQRQLSPQLHSLEDLKGWKKYACLEVQHCHVRMLHQENVTIMQKRVYIFGI